MVYLVAARLAKGIKEKKKRRRRRRRRREGRKAEMRRRGGRIKNPSNAVLWLRGATLFSGERSLSATPDEGGSML
jgi:hypothetical protein